MSKDWNDLMYGKPSDLQHRMHIGNTGAWYDDASDTIRWYAGDTFTIRFEICTATKEVTKQPSIYIKPQSDVSDMYAGYYFDFNMFKITGEQSTPCLSIKDITMNVDKGITIDITKEISDSLSAGIYSYSLIAHKKTYNENETSSIITLIGRNKGKIQILL